jgi:hypothetical protein
MIQIRNNTAQQRVCKAGPAASSRLFCKLLASSSELQA